MYPQSNRFSRATPDGCFLAPLAHPSTATPELRAAEEQGKKPPSLWLVGGGVLNEGRPATGAAAHEPAIVIEPSIPIYEKEGREEPCELLCVAALSGPNNVPARRRSCGRGGGRHCWLWAGDETRERGEETARHQLGRGLRLRPQLARLVWWLPLATGGLRLLRLRNFKKQN